MTNWRQRLRRTLAVVGFLLFQIPLLHLFMSPVLPIVAAWRGIMAASLLTYGVLFLLSLVLGRAFCAWFCPGTIIQELAYLVIKRPVKGGRGDRIKYVICGLWSASLVLAVVHAGGLRRFDPLFGTGPDGGPPRAVLHFGAFLPIIPLAALFGRWASCHYICWIAPFMVIGTRMKNYFGWPSLHLRASPDACLACATCSATCPMSLDVSAMVARGSMRNDECVLCGNCVDHCLTGAIQFAFARPPRQC
jgi:NAD-dependent dihydropyrimidine dehydrogenase PreA subunit